MSSSRPSQDRGRGKGKAPTQAYAMHILDYHDITVGTTVDSMLLVSSSWAYVLFDISASHSFISMLFANMPELEYEPLESTLSVGVQLDRDCDLSFRCSSVRIDISGRWFLVDLVIMTMDQFKVILGMDYLSTYQAMIYYACRHASHFPKNGQIVYQAI